MAKNPCNKVLNVIFTGKWAIETNHLDLIIGIASREISDMQAVLSMPTERRNSGTVNMRDGVAIINAFGPIFPRADAFTDISGATSVDRLALLFGEALNAPDVKAIVLNIDSPGGNVVGINEFANLVYESRGKKPIVAYTGGLCASAAYWIASAADRIIADKTAFLGSIGIVAAWTDDTEARKREGLLDYEVVSSQSPDKHRDINSDEGRAKLQAELDALADIFIGTVARNRNKRDATVQERFGNGGILISDEAVKVGMADEIGSLEGVIMRLVNGEIKVFNHSNKGALMSVITRSAEEKRKEEDEEEAKAKGRKSAKSEPDDNEEEEEEDAKAKAKAKKSAKAAPGDDEEEEDAMSTEAQMLAILAKHPAAYNAIKLAGIAEERARLKAIDEVRESAGNSDLVKNAMFVKPISAEALALQIVKMDKAAIKSAASAYESDAKAAGDVPGSFADDETDHNRKSMVNAVVSGFNAANRQGGKA